MITNPERKAFHACIKIEHEELPPMPHFEEKNNVITPTEEFVKRSDFRDYSISALKDAGIPINKVNLDNVVSPSEIDNAIDSLEQELKK